MPSLPHRTNSQVASTTTAFHLYIAGFIASQGIGNASQGTGDAVSTGAYACSS